jgi:pimeloyl-ACP methyl ester carboxylesterase
MEDVMAGPGVLKRVRTSSLEIAYEESGPSDGTAIILLHGFPYDPRAYDEVVPPLVAAGCRTIVPYLRGYGPTRFLAADIPRSGQQAALGKDLLDLLDALALPNAMLAGYDWGGRAACIVAALWPERVRGLVSGGGYNLQDIPGSAAPADPEQEHRYWYQYYFHTERGRAGLQENRRALCRLLWQLWSPSWQFDDATFERSAASFDNPDFVATVIQSYRHRFGYATGDPALEAIEQRLVAQPAITVPTIVLHGAGDGVHPPEGSAAHGRHFTGPYRRVVIPVIGHNIPQEAPALVVEAVRELIAAGAAKI